MDHFHLNNATQALDIAGVFLKTASKFSARDMDQSMEDLTARLCLNVFSMPTRPEPLELSEHSFPNAMPMDPSVNNNAIQARLIAGVLMTRARRSWALVEVQLNHEWTAKKFQPA